MSNNKNNAQMKDEQLQILINTFGKGGLQFICHASPTSKQSKNKIKKQVTKEILQKMVSADKYLNKKKKRFYEKEISLELTFGLEKRRYKRSDVDNLIKNTLDCLKGILFKDDSQIKKISGTKFFVHNEIKEWTGIRLREYY